MNAMLLFCSAAFLAPLLALSFTVRHDLTAFAGVNVEWVYSRTTHEKIYPQRTATQRRFAVPLLGYLDRGRLRVVTRNGNTNAYSPFWGKDALIANSYGDFLVKTQKQRGPVRIFSYDGQLKWKKDGFGAPRVLAGGRYIALFDRQNTAFRIFTDTSKALTGHIRSSAFITDLDAAVDGSVFVYATIRGQFVIFNQFRTLWKHTVEPRYRNPVTAAALSRDGRYVAAVTGHPRGSRLAVFDVSSGQRVWRLPLGRDYIHRTALAWLPDHTLVFEAADGVHALTLPRKQYRWHLDRPAETGSAHVGVSHQQQNAAVTLSSGGEENSRVYLFREHTLHAVITLGAPRATSVIRDQQLFIITPRTVSGLTIRPLADFQTEPEEDLGDEYY